MNTGVKRKQNQKPEFLVHFASNADFDLDAFIVSLQKKYSVIVINRNGENFQTIRIAIRPYALRMLQRKLPLSVLVSYELLEPETC